LASEIGRFWTHFRPHHVCLTGPTPARGQIDPPHRVEMWTAALDLEPGSSATGRCVLFPGWIWASTAWA